MRHALPSPNRPPVKARSNQLREPIVVPRSAMRQLQMSTRGFHRMLKLARTIAHLV